MFNRYKKILLSLVIILITAMAVFLLSITLQIKTGIAANSQPMPIPIYRCFNGNHHFYTQSNVCEGASGYHLEGTSFYAYKNQQSGTIPIFRYFFPASGEHFYSRAGNCENATGCNSEGVGFYAYSSQLTGLVPVYRYFFPANGEHFYTTSANCEGASGCNAEGIGFYTYASLPTVNPLPPSSAFDSQPPPVAIYRCYNSNHLYFYTKSVSCEGAFEYHLEGVGFYAFNYQHNLTQPIYRYFFPASGEHFYTRDSHCEGKSGCNAEGVGFYAYPSQWIGTVPVYRYNFNRYPFINGGDYFFSISENCEGTNGCNIQGRVTSFYAYSSMPGSNSGAVAIGTSNSNSSGSTRTDTPTLLPSTQTSIPVSFILTPRGIPLAAEAVSLNINPPTSNSLVPIYRCAGSTYLGFTHHFYSQYSDCENSIDFQREGTAFYAYNYQAANTVPIYRYFFPDSGEFFYTTDNSCENRSGCVYEGISFYAYSSGSAGTPPPLYPTTIPMIYPPAPIPISSYHLNNMEHFYTDSNTCEGIGSRYCTFEKTAFYAISKDFVPPVPGDRVLTVPCGDEDVTHTETRGYGKNKYTVEVYDYTNYFNSVSVAKTGYGDGDVLGAPVCLSTGSGTCHIGCNIGRTTAQTIVTTYPNSDSIIGNIEGCDKPVKINDRGTTHDICTVTVGGPLNKNGNVTVGFKKLNLLTIGDRVGSALSSSTVVGALPSTTVIVPYREPPRDTDGYELGGYGSLNIKNCDENCSARYLDSDAVTLTFVPPPISTHPLPPYTWTFSGWVGDVPTGCQNSLAAEKPPTSCVVPMNRPRIIKPEFRLYYNLKVERISRAQGFGNVYAPFLNDFARQPATINCGLNCQDKYLDGTIVDLITAPTVKSHTTKWFAPDNRCKQTELNVNGDLKVVPCTVTTDKDNKVVTAEFSSYTLTVARNTTNVGFGAVNSYPDGINCQGKTCAAKFNYRQMVSLSTVPVTGSYFNQWGGVCNGNGNCQIMMDAPKQIIYSFDRINSLTINKIGSGTGVVTSAQHEINCGATCSYNFNLNARITLSAAPTNYSSFNGWSGTGCSGTGACVVLGGYTNKVSATFSAHYAVTPLVTGNGNLNNNGSLIHLISNDPQKNNSFALQIFEPGETPIYNIATPSGYTLTMGGTCGGNFISANQYQVSPLHDHCTVEARFDNIFTVTISPLSSNSHTGVLFGRQKINYGDRAIVNFSPDSGYTPRIASTTCGNGGNLNERTYTTGPITNNCTLAVRTYHINPSTAYTVTASAGGGGSISRINTPSIIYGGTQVTFILTSPGSGYKIRMGGTCGGNLTLGDGGDYPYGNNTNYFSTYGIVSNCTVEAAFIKI